MLFVTALYLAVFLQEDVQFKSDDEFAIKFSFSFSKRGEGNRDDFVRAQVASSAYDRPDNSPLPFMEATLEILKKTDEEVKVRIVRDHDMQIAKKKITAGMTLSVFSGFVDDIKDQVAGYNHTVFFLDKDGNALSRVVIEFDEEGFYYVNGKKRGKLT